MAQGLKHVIRRFSTTSKRPKNIITTPIFYVNGPPHIGHLYTAVLADAAHRFNRLLGQKDSYLVTGTDEHGVKVEEAANAAVMETPDFCDKVAAEYKHLFQQYGIQFSDFIRTTEERHKLSVHHFWKELSDRGFITKGKYSGWYCKADEAFLTNLHVTKLHGSEKFSTGENPVYVSVESGHPVEWTEEENFVFPLGKLMSDVKHWIKNENVIQPSEFHRQAEANLSEFPESETLSLSRPSKRVNWGIRVPGHEDQTIYVWLDALISYLTAAGYPDKVKMAQNWPPKIQVIGKDILRFHAMYWPAFLIAAGLEPPPKLVVHSHWTVDHEKMSKSKGNVISPPLNVDFELITSFRYFLLRCGTPRHDNDFNSGKVAELAHSDLGSLGNLLNRVTTGKVNLDQDFPGYDDDVFVEISQGSGAKLIEAVNGLADEVRHHYESCNFYQGLQSVVNTVNLANEFVQREEPWKLVKTKEKHDRLKTVLHVALESIRVCSIALQPIVPDVADTALTKLAISPNDRSWSDMRKVSWQEGLSKSHKGGDCVVWLCEDCVDLHLGIARLYRLLPPEARVVRSYGLHAAGPITLS